MLFCIEQTLLFSHYCYECKAITSENCEQLKEIFEELLDDIHPHSIKLIDGYGIPESWVAHTSPLVRSDKNMYQNMLDLALEFGELNKFDVHPAMLEYIQNQQREQKLKNENIPKL